LTKLMSYASQLLFIAKALFVAGAVLPVLVAVWAILGSVPRSVRSRYHGRVMYMAQLPFTEEWRRQVNPDDLPLIVRARRRGFVFLLTVLVVMQFMAAGMYLNEVVQVHCCLIADLGRPDPACNHAGGRTGK